MINDVMGNIDGDDYGDYGDEGAAFTRENEAEYDFMWKSLVTFWSVNLDQ